MNRQAVVQRKHALFPVRRICRSVKELAAAPDDSTARQEALRSIVAFLRRHGYSKDALLIAWAFSEQDEPQTVEATSWQK